MMSVLLINFGLEVNLDFRNFPLTGDRANFCLYGILRFSLDLKHGEARDSWQSPRRWKGKSDLFGFLNVYDPHDSDKKSLFWRTLSSILGFIKACWCLFGDFNELRS